VVTVRERRGEVTSRATDPGAGIGAACCGGRDGSSDGAGDITSSTAVSTAASVGSPPDAGAAVCLAGPTRLDGSLADCPLRVLVRDSLRGDEESDEDEPADPVVSARATDGIEMIAAPTPSATARAPTRPT
jgi:hypothetical protein